jgi:hypothetical protein
MADVGAPVVVHALPRPLRLVVTLADEYGAQAEPVQDGSVIVTVSPATPGGEHDPFRLALSFEKGAVRVRQAPGEARLPPFCPGRHINPDGSFCLGWREEDPSQVRTPEEAGEWWASLLVFLGYQQYAEYMRAWPPGCERAHGIAAEFEARAESLAASFGPAFLQDLRTRRLRLRRMPAGLRLEREGAQVFALRKGCTSVVNLRAACPCVCSRRKIVLKRCGDHAQAAADLIEAMANLEEAEARFFRTFAGVVECCGTLAVCPLRIG